MKLPLESLRAFPLEEEAARAAGQSLHAARGLEVRRCHGPWVLYSVTNN